MTQPDNDGGDRTIFRCRRRALGLKWSRLDEETRTLQIRKAIQRRSWQHGCENPHACGAKYHKIKPCKAGASDTSAHARRRARLAAPAMPAGARSGTAAAWSKST